MTIGTFLVKKHSTQGYFDVSCSMTDAYFQGQQSNPTAVTIVLDNQAGINGVTMEWSHSSCGTNGAVFGDLPDNIFDTGNGAQANLAGCLRMNQDGNKYGYYQKNIEIQQQLGGTTIVYYEGGTNGVTTLKETWKFDLSTVLLARVGQANVPEGDQSILGVASAQEIDAQGKVSVPVSLDIRIGDGNAVFGDCDNYFTDSATDSAKSLQVEHVGSMIAAFDHFDSSYKSETLSPGSLVGAQVDTVRDVAGTGCVLRYTGAFERQFPIADMHTEYWDGACTSDMCNGALKFTYGTDAPWTVSSILFSNGETTVSTQSVMEKIDDAQVRVDLLPWGADISLPTLFKVNEATEPKSNLLQTVTRAAIADSSNCDVLEEKSLYEIPAAALQTWHKTGEEACVFAYPTVYNVPVSKTVYGEPSDTYIPNTVKGQPTADWTYGVFVLGSDTTATLSYTPTNILTTDLKPVCTAHIVTLGATSGGEEYDSQLKADVDDPECAFNSDILTTFDFTTHADYVDLPALKTAQTAATTLFADEQCLDVYLTGVHDIAITEASEKLAAADETSMSATKLLAADDTAVAAIAAVAAGTPVGSVETVVQQSGVHDAAIPGTLELDVTYNNEPQGHTFAVTAGSGVFDYNCGDATEHTAVYSKTVQFPCTTQEKTREIKTKVAFSSAQAKLEHGTAGVGVGDQSKSVSEVEHFDAGSITSHTFTVTSAAITRLKDKSKLSCVPTDTANFACQVGDWDGEGLLVTYTYKGVPDNILNDDAVPHSTTFTLTYTYNEACSEDTAHTTDDSFVGKVELTPSANLYRGSFKIKGGGSSVNETQYAETAQISANTVLQTEFALGADGTTLPTYELTFGNPSDAQTIKVEWDNTKVELVSGGENLGNKDVVLGPGGSASISVKLLDAAVDRNVNIGSKAGEFELTITGKNSKNGADTERVIKIEILNKSPPAKLKIESANCGAVGDAVDVNTPCEDHCCYGTGFSGFRTIGFDINAVPETGEGEVSALQVEIIPGTGVDAHAPITISGGYQARPDTQLVLSTNTDCKGIGSFQLKLKTTPLDKIYKVEFPCRRHAESSIVTKTVLLDYGIEFTKDKLKFSTDPTGSTSTIYAGKSGDVTCATSGVAGIDNAKCTNQPNWEMVGIKNIATLGFENCGTWDESATDTDDGSMDIVRKYTVDGENFCQLNSLALTVYNTGTASATVTVQSAGEASVDYTITKLEYLSCGNGGFRYKYELTGDITASIANPSSSIAHSSIKSASEPLALTSGDNATTISAQSDCLAVCGDSAADDLIDAVQTHTFQVDVDVNGEHLYADVQVQFQITGDPCAADAEDTIAADVDVQLVFAMEGTSSACAGATKRADSLTVQFDEIICAGLEKVDSTKTHGLSLVHFTFSDGDEVLKTSTADCVSANSCDAQFFYGGYANLASRPGAAIVVDADWEFDVTGRRLRTTYMLGSGSGSGGHSDASIRVLPAGVQVQDQIEAAAPVEEAEAEPVAEAETEEPAPAPAPSDTSDSGLSMEWIIIIVLVSVVAVGAALWAWLGCREQSAGRNDSANVQVVGVGATYKYKKLSRFTSNIDF